MSYIRRARPWRSLGAILLSFVAGSVTLSLLPGPETSFQVLADKIEAPADPEVKQVALFKEEQATGDWPMWGGTPSRNNVPVASGIPTSWNIGEFDDDDNWIAGSGKNIKWVSAVGSQTYGNPVVADGRVYVGTNNGHGYLERYPAKVDLGCLICFSEADGKFLWQHSSEKTENGPRA